MINLIITSPCGKHEWQHQSSFVPRIGEHITCRTGPAYDITFSGEVADVHYEVRKYVDVRKFIHDSGDMIVSVWLKEIQPADSGSIAEAVIIAAERASSQAEHLGLAGRATGQKICSAIRALFSGATS